MSEFTIHHHVSELIKIFNCEDKVFPEKYAENLNFSGGEPYVTAQSSQATTGCLARLAPNPSVFQKKYDDLKSRNVRLLDCIIQFLSGINEVEGLQAWLTDLALKRGEATFLPSLEKLPCDCVELSAVSRLSSHDVMQLRDRLQKESAYSHVPTEAFMKVQLQPERKFHPQCHEGVPQTLDWNTSRPHMTLDFTPGLISQESGRAPLGNLPLATQEQCLVEDLLYCLEGISGDYITVQPLQHPSQNCSFFVDDTCDASLHELVKRILPLCSHYSVVIRFVEEKSGFECGQVNQALAASIRTLVKDYLILVSQLETQFRQGDLTLQRLWYYLQPTMRTMELLAPIATSVAKAEAIGGEVLSLLHDATVSLAGDAKAQDLSLFLMQTAAIPYMNILEKWIYKGVIHDPCLEFFVEDNEKVHREVLPVDYCDDYWEKRYTIRREKIPRFLEKVADMVLRTGKYLNVIRQCDESIECPHVGSISYCLHERRSVDDIEKAYMFASRTLLSLLMEDKDLMGCLRSVKHYFLLDQGDFIVQFLDLCEGELVRNVDDIIPTRLESLLELALRTSAANSDPYKDSLRVELLPYDLMSQMFRILSIDTVEEKEYRMPPDKLHLSGLEAFAFGFDVKWPVSLVLNRKAFACYQMIFRHLFYSKHVERLLCSVWISNKGAKGFPLSSLQCYPSAFALRQRMLHFVQNLEYYMMFEVLEPNWHNFFNKMQSVPNVDEVLHCHTDFLNLCLKDCMLTSPELLRAVSKLMNICVTFASFMQTLDVPITPTEKDTFEQTVAKFDLQFTAMLISLLNRISDLGRMNYEDRFVNILYRLDFNGFYTERLEQLAMDKSRTGSSSEDRVL